MSSSGTQGASAPLFLISPIGPAVGLYADVATPGGLHGDSGTDLRFAEDVLIPPMAKNKGKPVIVDLKVRARCLVGGEFVPFQVTPRSSIGCTPLGLANSLGIIDSGYQGCLKVALRNFSDENWPCLRGDSLFQLTCPDLSAACVSVVDEKNPAFAVPTTRGAGGFGSTGAAGTK